MPIIKGTEYKLCLLDSCIISEILKNRKEEGKNFVQLFLQNHYVPCISIWSILELRKSRNLFNQFLDFLSIFPFFLTKSPIDIFTDEIKFYPQSSKVEPILSVFSPMNENQDLHLKTLENNQSFLLYENQWESEWKQSSLRSILSLKDNFAPRGKSYKAADAIRFVQEALPQYVYLHETQWSESLIKRRETPSEQLSFN